ncbi:hypothetical protein [Rhodococcus opacus]|uniref:hypothetical protein n=1 Tax=Rhodococcus opacus TaxID=37919 RepID=UPI000AE5EE56|nr:hypothetical protein E143388_07500 [Rhodococcus opacus]
MQEQGSENPIRPPVPHGAGGPVPFERCHPIPEDFPDRSPAGKFDDEDYPAYSMGHAAEILGVTRAFLRSLDAAKLLTPAAPRAVTVATPATSSDLPPAPAN